MKPKRVVSLLVAGCMAVSMVPASAVTAFAETVGNTSALAVLAQKCSNKRPLRCRRSDGKCFLGSGTKQYGCGESYIYTEHRRFRCNGGLQCNHR